MAPSKRPQNYLPVPTRDVDDGIPLRLKPRPQSVATTAHFATTTLQVEGMTCGACTSAIESAFKGVEGVGNVSVSLVMGRAVVVHDPQRLEAERIREMIEERGFEAAILTTDMPSPSITRGPGADFLASSDEEEDEEEVDASGIVRTTLKVEGMTCGACTSAIESGFENEPGVKHFSVSLLSERAVVEHDPTILKPARIAEIIEERGFDATVLETTSATKAKKYKKTKSLLATTTVAVEGMTCGACTSAVEGGFKDVDGVKSFNISLLAERAVVVYEPEKLSADKIAEIIEDRGFGAKVLSTQMNSSHGSEDKQTSHLKVYGLTDSDSASKLESSLRALPGVTAAVVNLHTSRASITHHPSVCGLRNLVDAVEVAGFNALVADADDNNAQLESLSKTREIQEWRNAFRFSLAFAIPVTLVSMIIPMFFPWLDCGHYKVFLPGLYLGDLLCLILTIPVQFGIGRRFYKSAYKSLKHGSPTMDVLVVLGTSAAFFFSVAAMIVSILSPQHSRPSTVFDTSTMLITFITLGRYLENRAKGQTSKALSQLMSLTPSMARIYADPIAAEKSAEGWELAAGSTEKKADTSSGAGVEEKVIPTELIQVGDIVILRPGDKIPADGTVTRGESYVDESMVTGEAMPVLKKKGSFLIGGTVNGAGRADFRVTRAGRDTQLSQIVKLVQEAQTNRAPIQRMADVVAGYFVPGVITLGLITFVGWMILSHVLTHPPDIFTRESSGGRFMVCLKLCISVIVFACPCALGLSTPTAVMVGTGVGAQQGILVKGGAALETSTKVTQVVLDKTGTITMGKMSVAHAKLGSVWETNAWRKLWWTLVGISETGSEHPVGKAIVQGAKDELGLGPDAMLEGTVGDFKAIVGRGIAASVEPASSANHQRYRILVGNVKFLQESGVEVPQEDVNCSEAPSQDERDQFVDQNVSRGRTYVFIAIDNAYAGFIGLSDTIKPDARYAVRALGRMGVKVAMVTGDQESTALQVAREVGISESLVWAGVSPDEKQLIVKDMRERGEVVAMVGDGINDSPALATADVGIAMASGTDVAMEAADVVLMRPTSLLDIPASLHLARTIFRRIKMNLMWACAYNLIGMPFAMGFFLPLGLHLHPMAAGAAMAASSVSVVCSSLLLKFWKRPKWMTLEAMEAEEEGRDRKGRRRTWSFGSLFRRSGKGQGYVALSNEEAV